MTNYKNNQPDRNHTDGSQWSNGPMIRGFSKGEQIYCRSSCDNVNVIGHSVLFLLRLLSCQCLSSWTTVLLFLIIDVTE